MVKITALKPTGSAKNKTQKVKKKITSDTMKSVKLSAVIKKNKDTILASALPKKQSKLVRSLESNIKDSSTRKQADKHVQPEFTTIPLKLAPSLKSNSKENKTHKKLQNKLKKGKRIQNAGDKLSSNLKKKNKLKKGKLIQNEDDELNSNLKKKFNIQIQDVLTAVDGLLKLRKTNPKLQKQLLSEERAPLFLQITCHKLPKGHSKILRIPLQHSVYGPEDDICLIVSEIKGIGNKEHEKHIEHYENLLKSKGISSIKTIMTCHQLRTEYETFEQKLRLVDLYDLFLVNGRVSGKVVKMCGKIFYKRNKVPVPVKLQASNLKEHIETTLKKVNLFLHLKGNSVSVQFGHTDMSSDALVQNIYAILEYLDQHFPGKFENIKGIHAYLAMAGSIPIYMSFKNPQEVPTPTLKPKTPKAYKAFTGELSTLPNAEVTVLPTGRVIVKRTKLDNEDASQNIITDKDLIDSNNYVTNSENGEQDEENQGATNKKRKDKKRKANTSDKNIVDHITENDMNQENKKAKISKKVKMIEKVKLSNKMKKDFPPAVNGIRKIKEKKNRRKAGDSPNEESKSKMTESEKKKLEKKSKREGGLAKTGTKKIIKKGENKIRRKK